MQSFYDHHGRRSFFPISLLIVNGVAVGVTAWSHGIVPNFVTSNCAIAQVSQGTLLTVALKIIVMQ